MIIRKLIYKTVIVSAIVSVYLSVPVYSQSLNLEAYQFIAPRHGSSLHRPETNIIIRHGERVRANSFNNNSISVVGSKSGVHSGELFLSTDFKTLIFEPEFNFRTGELVSVELKGNILTESGIVLLPLNFQFKITDAICDENEFCYKDIYMNSDFVYPNNKLSDLNSLVIDVKRNPPEDIPQFDVNIVNNPSDKFIFIAPYILSSPLIGYTMILDNDAVPIYYQRTLSAKLDFKLQFNGLLTYWDDIPQKFYMMDSSYAIVDSFECGNGYANDNHELLVFENGHSFLLATDPQYVRMDTIVQGGDPSAIVRGLIIQELDSARNVIFQWRSWDHFLITDATEDIDLTAHSIDYVHGNALEIDDDGNILLSSRHMDEITKINRQTGEIIWRFGGIKSHNNQFQFIGDPITFSHQHDIRKLPNGNVTLFDNGNLHIPPVSRSLEYQLDEINKIAVLVWKYNNNPTTFTRALASSRRLENHNTLIGWGYHFNARAVSEIKADGTVALEWLLPDSIFSYRVFKFNWRTNYFTVNPDSIFFESVAVGDSAIINVDVKNNSMDNLEINGFYNKNFSYSVDALLPINIAPQQSASIKVKFKPIEEGFFEDYLHIRSDNNTGRIAQILVMGGRTDTIFSNVENIHEVNPFHLEQNYPNPFNPISTIRFTLPEVSFVTLKIYDVLGNEIETLLSEELPAGTHKKIFYGHNFPSGVYFYQIQAGNFTDTKKLILLK